MAISIDNLSKSFDGQPVLRHFSARLDEGGVTCVMGPSGSGKTTLLHILMGLLPADEGNVDGLSGKRFSAVFQEDRLCENISAPANIRLVCGDRLSKAEVLQALEAIGLAESVGQPVRELSGGMKRRVALLRALLAPFDVLFLDEPFKGLDEETKKTTAEYVRGHIQGKTVLMVTHDREEAEMLSASVLYLG